MELSDSQAEYLKTIYIISNTGKQIRVTDIAEKLNLSKPSVTRAIKNLSAKQLLNYKAYGEIALTTQGKEKAREILKRQDIVKTFLTEVLEIEEADAEKESKALKNAITSNTEEKLEKYINKLLDLENSDCGYDKTNEKCRNCVKRRAKKEFK